ncbi:MAG: polysulfide reductase NrfD [Deltaproteobacteria bacterium]|nr:polysulfide reductase NrfD [Deltaproteobacteria bacterium]
MHGHPIEFMFPNDHGSIAWTLMIVLYPYITGLVAGAFVVAALYHVFGKKELAPVARFALAASFSFCAFATMPLLLHLHQPQRAFNIMFTPNFTSAMAGFGFIYSFYLTLLGVEILLVFRDDIVARANRRGVEGWLYKVLALGVTNQTPGSRALDHKWISALSVIGIPAACVLHGYVGFIFGGIKANPWWSTALMPVIFLCSAIVSGVAMLILLYVIASKFRRVQVDDECLRSMMRTLWLFLILAVALEELELLNMAYESGAQWAMLSRLIHEKLHFSFTWLQLILGSVVPFFLLLIGMRRGLHPGVRIGLGTVSGLLVLIQVMSMRWNVVIGGQLLSKSFRGFNNYLPEFGGREGLGVAVLVFCLPFVLMFALGKILPLWKTDAADGH